MSVCVDEREDKRNGCATEHTQVQGAVGMEMSDADWNSDECEILIPLHTTPRPITNHIQVAPFYPDAEARVAVIVVYLGIVVVGISALLRYVFHRFRDEAVLYFARGPRCTCSSLRLVVGC